MAKFFEKNSKDFISDPKRIFISYTKNGIDLGVAFVINKDDLTGYYEEEFVHRKTFENTEGIKEAPGLVFFPHVLTKNVVFEMNFGQRVSLIGDEPFAPIKSDYLLIQKIPIEKRFCTDFQQRSKPDNDLEV